jgi:inner membrane protein
MVPVAEILRPRSRPQDDVGIPSSASVSPRLDPLTHTLVGANLAATRLATKSRFAASALVVGANFPDIDVLADFIGDDFSRGFRRGWTHGLPAHIVLPFVLTAILLLIDRLRPDAQRKADPRWLLLLSAIGIWTHPALDWLNTYGMRWLMPLRPTWFYGDAVYIMDPWLWLILGAAFLAGRRATVRLIVVFLLVAALITNVVAGRAPQYLIVIAAVAAILFLALLLKPVRRKEQCALAALAVASLYIGSRITISEFTEDVVARRTSAERIMVSPDPINPLSWGFVIQAGDEYRFGTYDWMSRRFQLAPDRLAVAKPSPAWDAARRHPSVRGFMTWIRFPAYEVEHDGNITRVHIIDARRMNRRRGGFGGAVVELPGHYPR